MATNITWSEVWVWTTDITYNIISSSPSNINYSEIDRNVYLWEENNLVWELDLPWNFSNIVSTINWNDLEV